MPHPLLIFSQSHYLIQTVDINSNTYWQTVQIQISWLHLDLHCLQRQGISGFSRTRVKQPYNLASEVIKLFSCSTQLSMKFVRLINLKLLTIANSFLLNTAEHENFSANKYENANYCWHFHIY